MKKRLQGLKTLVLAFILVIGQANACLAFADKGDIAISAGEIIFKENNAQSYNVIVSADGNYYLKIEYKTVSSRNVTPQMEITLKSNKETLANQTVDLPRIWKNNIKKPVESRFERDSSGNEILPTNTEVCSYQTQIPSLSDKDYLTLSRGSYTLILKMLRQEVCIKSIALEPVKEVSSYNEYREYAEKNGSFENSAVSPIKQEAELTDGKSHMEINLSYDRTSPAISPNDPIHIIYNIIGGSGYDAEGQWLSWEINVPKSGFYNFDFSYRQNINDGLSVRRKLLIDGKLPFKECEMLLFPSNDGFEALSLSDNKGKPYDFYLSEGKHEFKLQVVLTGQKQIINKLSDTIKGLNGLYGKIMVIVGETPDIYRDYNLDESIVGLGETLNSYKESLESIAKALQNNGSSSGSNTARIYEAARTLNNMSSNMRDIPKNIDNFRSQINTLADLLGSIRSQPLELDYFTLSASSGEKLQEKSGFWDFLVFRTKSFIASFFKDYSTVNSANAKKNLKIWVSTNDVSAFGYSTGRDQAQIINRLITSGFTAEKNVSVNLSLISSSDTLLPALVSGKGPDAALFIPKTVLMNLYYRNALVDLRKEMPNYDSIEERFYPASLVSMKVGDKTYALPEIFTYNMMFYRTDIFSENNIEPPKTWFEFRDVLAKLQNAGMQIGISESSQIYEMFLFQNGGTLYNDNMSKTKMTETASVNAFASWTDLYVKHGLPYTFDGLNRFRTGQMPLIFSTANFYGQITVGAPEIMGLWEMVPVVGTMTKDGIDNSESCNVSGAAVLKSSKKISLATEFLDWWTSDGVQQKFGFENESQLGVSARYFSANKSVLPTLSWTAAEYSSLKSQSQVTKDNPQSPAAYYVTRNLSNAFRRVLYQYENSRDVIFRYSKIIDDELTRKRTELGLENER